MSDISVKLFGPEIQKMSFKGISIFSFGVNFAQLVNIRGAP